MTNKDRLDQIELKARNAVAMIKVVTVNKNTTGGEDIIDRLDKQICNAVATLTEMVNDMQPKQRDQSSRKIVRAIMIKQARKRLHDLVLEIAEATEKILSCDEQLVDLGVMQDAINAGSNMKTSLNRVVQLSSIDPRGEWVASIRSDLLNGIRTMYVNTLNRVIGKIEGIERDRLLLDVALIEERMMKLDINVDGPLIKKEK